MKRGQSALEYLVTYGWAILAIVIIGAVLWYFGIFNPSSFAGSKQCTGGVSFVCEDFTVSATGNTTIILANKIGRTATTMDGTGLDCTPATVGANQRTTCWSAVLGAPVAAGTSGAEFAQTQITVTYTDSQSGLSHTDTMTVRGKYE